MHTVLDIAQVPCDGKCMSTGTLTLRQHMRDMHKGALPRSDADLVRKHKRDHWQLWLNHTHGPTTGPDDRPPGWTTGEGVVMRTGSR